MPNVNPTTAATALKVEPLCANLGALITGIDFGQPVAEAVRNQLYALWLQYGLLLIRGEHDSPESQIAFSRLFGELEAHPLETIRSKGYPELMELDSLDNRTNPASQWDGETVIGRLGWHTDLIYAGKPNRGAILRAVKIPEHDGQTGYADQAAAYDALSETMKARIDGLEVVYRFEVDLQKMPFYDTSSYVPAANAPKKPADIGFPDFPDSVYPLVLEHPETGRRILNVCPMFLVRIHDMDPAESDELLAELVAHVTRDEFAYLHDWRPGDMILWDNWRFMHSAPGVKPGQHRLIHRTTILGDRTLGRPLQ